MYGCLLHAPYWGTWPATQVCVLDWKLNQQSFSLQAGAQSTEPHQVGQGQKFLSNLVHLCIPNTSNCAWHRVSVQLFLNEFMEDNVLKALHPWQGHRVRLMV